MAELKVKEGYCANCGAKLSNDNWLGSEVDEYKGTKTYKDILRCDKCGIDNHLIYEHKYKDTYIYN